LNKNNITNKPAFMKIGIIGSGTVGQVLAKAFTAEGYSVILGTRNTSKEDVLKFNKDSGIAVADFENTAANSELIVLCTKGSAAEEALKLAGIANLSGKVIIDTTNPIAPAPPVNGALKYFTSMNESLMEQSQKLVPEAKFVKAFNSVGNAVMYKPQYADGKPTMFICGNDDAAKKTVTEILTSFGWETEDLGKAELAGSIEALCILWCAKGFNNNMWNHAFKLLKK
jgi:predicted dinucleotide-binding enzyme